jgi:hypothetical protein
MMLSFNMGFVGVFEDSAAGAGSIVLDMLLKFEVLEYNKREMWELEVNTKSSQLALEIGSQAKTA